MLNPSEPAINSSYFSTRSPKELTVEATLSIFLPLSIANY